MKINFDLIMKTNLSYIFIRCINVIYIVTGITFGLYFFKQGLNFESGDYIAHYLKWFNHAKTLGFVEALSTDYTDYPYGFELFLYIFSLIPLESFDIDGYKPLWNIKIMIYFFYILIPISSYFIVKYCTNDKYLCAKTFFITSISPTIILNSAVWGQMDCIWVSLLLFSLNFLIRAKYALFFLFIGFAISMKQTTILFLPFVFLMILKKKEINLYHILFFLIGLILLSLPSLLAMKTFNILLPYIYESKITNALVANFSNIYSLFTVSPLWYSWFIDPMYTKIFLFMCVGILIILIADLNYKEFELNPSNMMLLATMFFVVVCNFLPGIHDRYMLFADVSSVLYVIISRKSKDIWIPIFINFVSAFNCINYLKGIAVELSSARIVMVQLVSIGFFAFTIYLIYYSFNIIKNIK